MRAITNLIFSAMLLCVISFAQNTTPPSSGTQQQNEQSPTATPAAPSTAAQPTPAAAPSSSNSAQANTGPRIAPGSVIPVQLTRSVDAKKVRSGDEVDARVTQDLKTSSGELIVPKNTKVIGHVTETQVRNKEQKESQLGITFDHAELKTGGEVTLPMSIQAIIAPPSLTQNNGNASADAAAQPNSQAPTPVPGANMGRPMGTAPAATEPMPSVPTESSTGQSASGQAGASPRPQITGNTQGVIGLPNLNLSPGQNGAQGSVVSSEKGNVKLESGTFMLLRVNR